MNNQGDISADDAMTFKQLHRVLTNISDMLKEENSWVYQIFEVAISEISSILLLKTLSYERIKSAKKTIHLCDCIVSGMSERGMDIDDLAIFSFLYAILDILEEQELIGNTKEETDASE